MPDPNFTLPSDPHHVAHHVTLSPILNSPVSDLSTPLLEKLKTQLGHSSFPPFSLPYNSLATHLMVNDVRLSSHLMVNDVRLSSYPFACHEGALCLHNL